MDGTLAAHLSLAPFDEFLVTFVLSVATSADYIKQRSVIDSYHWFIQTHLGSGIELHRTT